MALIKIDYNALECANETELIANGDALHLALNQMESNLPFVPTYEFVGSRPTRRPR